MRGWRRVHAAIVIAAALVVCCVGVSTGPARAGDGDEARLILFSGSDLWGDGAFAHGGLLWSPGGSTATASPSRR